ncbi:MAG: hypothetical protein K2M19_06950 [Muribaculaceae bacterium]|nr:hypothetical protein [Muribaculaceae bacterium]
MRKFILPLLIVALPALWSCQSSDIYSELPEPLQHFMSKYWPNPAIEAFTPTYDGGYTVTVKNGVTATFNSEYSWTDINGDGLPLPQMLLSDQLPAKLYDYIEGAEMLNQVFVISRNFAEYNVTLLNSSLKYTVSDGMITGSQKP